MGLEFLDSFDGYSNSEFLLRWENNGSGTMVTGRNGKGAQIAAGDGLIKTTNYNDAWVAGFALYMNLGGGPQAGPVYFTTTPGWGNLLQVWVEADGSVSLKVFNTTIGNSGSGASPVYLHLKTWYYIEVKYTMSGTTSISITASLRINKQTVINSVSGTAPFNISSTLTNTCRTNQHALSVFNGNTGWCIFDDFYLFNQSGSVNNDYAGDIKILVIEPNVDINNNFTGNVGGSLFSLINEVPPDYDTKYIYSATDNAFQNFYWQHLPAFFGNVICVQYTIFARKDDEGSRAFQHTMGLGPDVLSDPHYIGDSYCYYMWPFDTAPLGVFWTVAVFNSTSFGIYVFKIPLVS